MASNKTLELELALDLLRRPDHRLLQMHINQHERAFFVVPGGRVARADAEKIINRPDVFPYDDGLFPGCAQSWKLGTSHAGGA
jgi:hypothetical protein